MYLPNYLKINKVNESVNIGSKIDKKRWFYKESELLKKQALYLKYENMPEWIWHLFKSMNMDQFIPKGGKFNNNAFQNMMDQNVKMSKMKERMRKKAEQNKNNPSSDEVKYSKNYEDTKNSNFNNNSNNLKDINNNLETLMKQMQDLQNNEFIADILKQQNMTNNESNNNKKNNVLIIKKKRKK